MENPSFEITMRLLDNYKFEIDFGQFGQLISDEPEPLGDGEGPNPSRMLAAATANCMAASLLFAIRKYKGDPGSISATARGEMARIDGRWRIPQLAVELQLGASAESLPQFDRVLEQFENFCVVTQSVRAGIEVAVTVRDSSGEVVKQT
jgi:organic hydroperoxide reductase OsmC/OhrA